MINKIKKYYNPEQITDIALSMALILTIISFITLVLGYDNIAIKIGQIIISIFFVLTGIYIILCMNAIYRINMINQIKKHYSDKRFTTYESPILTIALNMVIILAIIAFLTRILGYYNITIKIAWFNIISFLVLFGIHITLYIISSFYKIYLKNQNF